MVSKIGLWVTVCSSLRWLCVAASLWMWNRSRVFRCGPFLWNCKMFITSWMGPKECMWLFKYSANLDVRELCLKARLCSLYLEAKSLQFGLCTLSHSRGRLVCTRQSVWILSWCCVLWATRLCSLLFVRKAICRLECLNMFVMCLVSLPVYVKVSHLCSLFGGRRGS